MSLASLFGFGGASSGSSQLPNIFPLSIIESDFVKSDVVNIYTKILTDTLERTKGVTPEIETLLFDNCLQSESSDGLISLLAKAMAGKEELFLVYKKEVGVIHKADNKEKDQIIADYKAQNKSSLGVYVSFKNYSRSDMVKLYSSLEYSVVTSLYKNMSLSKSIQLKISDLRGSVSLTDSSVANAQAELIAKGMSEGRDVLLDAKDIIETAKPDLTATEKSMVMIQSRRAFYLGMPTSFLTGDQTAGIGSTGEADTKATERGLLGYYFSIIKPVIKALFEIDTTFKSQDFRMLTLGLEALKTFSLIDDSLISSEEKKQVIDILFSLNTDEQKK